MPRRSKGARLWYREDTEQYVIRDGNFSRRTKYGLEQREEAEKELAEYIASKALVSRSGPCRMHELTVGEVLARYVEDKGEEMRSREVLAANVRSLADFFGNETCDAVNGGTCRAYLKHRAKGRLDSRGRHHTAGPSAVRRELSVLQVALNYAKREGLLIDAPSVTLPREAPPRERYLTRSESIRLLRAAAPHVRRFILISLHTGRRMSAVLELTWARVDLERKVIRFRRDGEIETNKRRGQVIMTGKLLSHFRRWRRIDRRGETHVVHYRGGSIANIKTAFRKAVLRAGLDPSVTCHVLKHTAITWAVSKGSSVEGAAEFFDTSPATIRKTYWHHSDEYQRETAEILDRKR